MVRKKRFTFIRVSVALVVGLRRFNPPSHVHSESCVNPNLGRLFRSLFSSGGGGNFTLNLLELCLNLKIWYVSTQTYVVSENIPFSTKTPFIFLMSTFFCKKSAFFVKNSTFPQSISMKAVLEIF